MSSKDDRKVTRLPLTLTCQSYLPCALQFSMPTVAPKRLMCSLDKQPQDCVCPPVSISAVVTDSLPQSHRQRQQMRPATRDCSSSISSATSRPNRWPVMSLRRATPLRQPQDTFCHLPRVRVDASRFTAFPQSQRQSHTPCPLSRVSRSITVNEPKRFPVKSLYSNRSSLGGLGFAHLRWIRQPQLFVCPNRNLAAVTVVSLPQSQRHNHLAPPLPLCEYRSATSLPKRCPVKSIYGPIGCAFLQPQLFVTPDFKLLASAVEVFPQSHKHSHETLPGRDERRMTTRCPNLRPTKSMNAGICHSNNNAPHACPVKLPRRHTQHERRSYQYSTRARRLGISYFTIKGVI